MTNPMHPKIAQVATFFGVVLFFVGCGLGEIETFYDDPSSVQKEALTSKTHYIVVLHEPLDLSLSSSWASRHQRRTALKTMFSQLTQDYSITPLEYYPWVFGALVKIDNETERWRFIADERVKYLENNFAKDNHMIESAQETSVTDSTDPVSWGLDRIDQESPPLDGVFSPPNHGAGVHVYVVDTGIDTEHPEFSGRVGNGFDIAPNERDGCCEHGTHVAGTVAGQDFGVAREVIIHDVRIYTSNNGYSLSKFIEAHEWIHDHLQFPAVINSSWYLKKHSRALEDTIRLLVQRGATYIAAAGNQESTRPKNSYCYMNALPASMKEVITVASSTKHDYENDTSASGACTDLHAPGKDIRSIGGIKTGTSMAAPHVSGAAAIILNEFPHFTPEQVRAVIIGQASIMPRLEPLRIVNVSKSTQTQNESALLYNTELQIQVSGQSLRIGPETSTESLIAFMDYYADGKPIGRRDRPKLWLEIDTVFLPEGINNIKAIVFARDGSVWSSRTSTISIQNPQRAAYSDFYMAPLCSTNVGACDSGPLLQGMNWEEVNAPAK